MLAKLPTHMLYEIFATLSISEQDRIEGIIEGFSVKRFRTCDPRTSFPNDIRVLEIRCGDGLVSKGVFDHLMGRIAELTDLQVLILHLPLDDFCITHNDGTWTRIREEHVTQSIYNLLLRLPRLEVLDLKFTTFDADCRGLRVAEFMRGCGKHLTTFSYYGSVYGDEEDPGEGAESLAETLGTLSQLQVVRLRKCHLGRYIEYLNGEWLRRLQVLDLTGCSIQWMKGGLVEAIAVLRQKCRRVIVE